MKKLLYTLLAVSIIFAACSKEEDETVTPSIVGVWTPTSVSGSGSMTAVVLGEIVDSFDTTFTMTAAEADMDGDVEFTADGNMYIDGDTNSYTYSDNLLTITEDGESETNPCTVTSTSLTVIFSETETSTEDYMGLEATITETNEITLNATRQ
jgi:hypothetical protein